MSIQIAQKKKFVLFIIGLAVFMGAVGWVGYHLIATKNIQGTFLKKGQKNNSAMKRQQEDSVGDNLQDTQPKVSYNNNKYKYTVNYPSNWYITTKDAETELTTLDPQGGIEFPVGGEIYWSNYPDIDKYTPFNKPDDFHLLALVIYQGGDITTDEFVKKIGISQEAISSEFETQTRLLGIQYITADSQGDLKMTVIFKNGTLFYVFKTAFISGDDQSAGVMESIVKSFKLD